MAEDILEQYNLGSIAVTIRSTDNPNKVLVEAHDDTRKMRFEARMYDYKNYYRHMNQKIRQRFQEDTGA